MTAPAPAAPRSAAATGTAAALGAALGFASVSIITSLALAEDLPLAGVLTWRYALASVMLLGWLAATGWEVPSRRDLPRLLIIGGVGQGIIVYLALSSLKFITPATLGFLFFTFPAWVAIVQAVRGAEALNRRRVLALALALLGVVVMVGAPQAADLDWRGVSLALGAAFLYGLFIPLLRWLQADNSITLTTTWTKIGAALMHVAVWGWQGGVTASLSGRAWLLIGALAFFSTVLPSLFFLKAINVIGPVRTAIVSTVEPFLTALLAVLILSQGLTITTIIGGALIGAAVWILQGVGRRATVAA
ncbi:MAG: DMT family transporter [Gemmatimonadales bacterium]